MSYVIVKHETYCLISLKSNSVLKICSDLFEEFI